MSCFTARNQGLAAMSGTLDASRRLALEAHLASCASCARAQAGLRLFDHMKNAEPPALSPQARARVLAKIVAAEPAPVRAPARRAPVWALAAALAAAVVSAWLGLAGSGGRAERIADTSPTESVPPSGPRVVAFGSSRIVPTRGAVVAWAEDARTLRLSTGGVRVSLALGGGTMRVVADRFVVVAAASVFMATTHSVSVEVGWVRIEDRAGHELARVSAGGEWRVSSESAPSTASTAAPPSRSAGLLRDAEANLARGRIAEARDLVAEILASNPSRAQAAEAGLLLADAARIEGHRDEAARRYRQIARTSRGSAGENALYAAAQLEAAAGRRAESTALLREYLSRYPDGRFAHAAAERLGRER